MMMLWPWVWWRIAIQMAFPPKKSFTPKLVEFPKHKRGRKKK
jgi:hypothetical protein